MDKNRKLIRFYQNMSNKPFFMVKYYCENQIFWLKFDIVGLELKMSYFSENSKEETKKELVPEKSIFITEKIEDELLELVDNQAIIDNEMDIKEYLNDLFDFAIETIGNILVLHEGCIEISYE